VLLYLLLDGNAREPRRLLLLRAAGKKRRRGLLLLLLSMRLGRAVPRDRATGGGDVGRLLVL
jgi:hypothetical protein